jgi:hypothetical protein
VRTSRRRRSDAGSLRWGRAAGSVLFASKDEDELIRFYSERITGVPKPALRGDHVPRSTRIALGRFSLAPGRRRGSTSTLSWGARDAPGHPCRAFPVSGFGVVVEVWRSAKSTYQTRFRRVWTRSKSVPGGSKHVPIGQEKSREFLRCEAVRFRGLCTKTNKRHQEPEGRRV